MASIVDKLVWQAILVSISVVRTSLVRIQLVYSEQSTLRPTI